MIPGILLLYHHPMAANAPTIAEHVNAFAEYSRYPVWSINTACGFPATLHPLRFRTVVLHYSLFGSHPFALTEPFRNYLRRRGDSRLVAFFQDEHQNCQARFRLIDELRVDAIYSLLEPTEQDVVYRRHTSCQQIHHTLTGYVDGAFVARAQALFRPEAERTVDIGYRARPLPYYMGHGAQEKTGIADGFLRRLAGSDLVLDVRTAASDRIYGEDWYRFVANCRGMIGVEAGVTVFDLTGEAREQVQQYLRSHPAASFEEVHDVVLKPYEDKVYYRTISPRIFEAAALRVCLILFEGRYNGIVEPMQHYIPLKKDFSNFDTALQIFRDPAERRRITENAHRDLIASRRYSYRAFIHDFDENLAAQGVPAVMAGVGEWLGALLLSREHASRHAVLRAYARARSAAGRAIRSSGRERRREFAG